MSTVEQFITVESEEQNHLFLCFCTYVTLTFGKKLNIANIFLLFLQNANLRKFFKQSLDIDSDYDCIKVFLAFDPTLYKSKYVMKYLNKAGKSKIK